MASKSVETGGKDNGKVKLKKVLSIWDASAYLICTIIGSGIFVSPKGVLLQTVSPGMALVVWGITGCINLIASFCYAELSLTFPTAGSDYTYLREAFGNFVGFLFTWVVFVFRDGCVKAILSLTFSTYFCEIFFSRCSAPETLIKLVAAFALTTLTAVQCYSSKLAVKFADFFTVAKLVGLFVIIGSGMYYVFGAGNDEKLATLMKNSSTEPAAYALAFYAAFWAYGGIQNAINVVEEIREPLTRNVIGSILFSQLSIMAVYLATNFAYVAVLSPQEILASDAVAMTFGDRVLTGLFWMMPFFVACSTFGSLSNSIMNSSRFLIAATRERHLPKPLGLLSIKYITPIPVYILNLIICLALLSSNKIYDLILYTSYINILGIAGSVLSLIYLRIKNPNLKRPFTLPLALPILFACVLLILLFFPIYQTPGSTGVCFLFIASGIPVYFILIYPDKKIHFLLRFEQIVTHLVQKLAYAVEEEDSDAKDEIANSKKGEINLAYVKHEESKQK